MPSRFLRQGAGKSVLERANAAQERYQQTVFDIEYKLNSAWADYQNQHDRIIACAYLP